MEGLFTTSVWYIDGNGGGGDGGAGVYNEGNEDGDDMRFSVAETWMGFHHLKYVNICIREIYRCQST